MMIKETIVVEGKDDETRLKSLYDVDIIKTNGTHLSKEIIEEIREAQRTKGVIIFTDPDHPGEEIRRKINNEVKGCLNAFLTNKSREKNKVGVEHASDKQIKEALDSLLTYKEDNLSLTFEEYCELGLTGLSQSQKLRKQIEDYYHLGHGSSKTLFKRLNYKGIRKEEIRECLTK